MSYELEISDQVFDDLARIADWYRDRFGDCEVGDRWIAGFADAIESLKRNPDRSLLAYEAEVLGMPVRELNYGSGKKKTHRALFVIEGQLVRVLLIRHCAQRRVTRDDIASD